MTSDYKKTKRKFNDAWAFILFIIMTIGCNTVYALSKTKSVVLPNPDSKLLIASGVFVLAFLVVMTICFLTIPGPLMHISFILYPLAAIGVSIYHQNTFSMILAIVYGALSIFLYLFLYRKNIKFSAEVLKSASRSTMGKAHVILPMVFFCLSIMLLQIVFALKNMGNKYEDQYPLYIILVLQYYWVFFFFLYVVRVNVSSVIILDILTVERASIAYESLKNTFYSLGSISFGSLLIAIVTTLKHLVNQSNRNQRNGLAGAIIALIASILLSLLQDIVEFINDWTFVYMAMYGQKYVDSIKGAYDLLTRGNNFILVNSLCIYPMLNLATLGAGMGYVYMLYCLKIPFKTHEDFVVTFLIAIMCLLLINIYLSLFEAGVKAFMFTYEKEPYSVRDKYPKTYEALEKQRLKN